MTGRAADTARLYDLLDHLEARVGGARVLADCSGRMNWPQRGVYFFYENGENRSGLGGRRRVVRPLPAAILGRRERPWRGGATAWGGPCGGEAR